MIYLLVLLDILINNYTSYTSYFFIIYLYNRSYKYYLLTGLILDLIIFDSYYNTIILSIIYLINIVFNSLNKNNFYNYFYINIFNYLVYVILSNLVMNNNIENILVLVGSNLVINGLFYLLSYRQNKRLAK